jgi:hypothetical protein
MDLDIESDLINVDISKSDQLSVSEQLMGHEEFEEEEKKNLLENLSTNLNPDFEDYDKYNNIDSKHAGTFRKRKIKYPLKRIDGAKKNDKVKDEDYDE